MDQLFVSEVQLYTAHLGMRSHPAQGRSKSFPQVFYDVWFDELGCSANVLRTTLRRGFPFRPLQFRDRKIRAAYESFALWINLPAKFQEGGESWVFVLRPPQHEHLERIGRRESHRSKLDVWEAEQREGFWNERRPHPG